MTDQKERMTNVGSVEVHERPKWSRKLDFLFSCIGFAIGLGNVWRFPYLCYRNGGGAFLIPYLIFALILGVPLTFLEVALGQFTASGSITAWNICPLLKGLGYVTVYQALASAVYYNIIIAWCLHYLYSSFTQSLPWTSCNNTWNTDFCLDTLNSSSFHSMKDNHTIWQQVNSSALTFPHTEPVDEYWTRKVLGLSDGIEHMGNVKWDLALCLLFAWVIVFACLYKGIKSSGLVVYFTATVPYILMCILLVRAVTLPGSSEGIRYYIIPDWKRLADAQVWIEAATQVLWSFSLGSGYLIALGSYNKFHHNSWRDTVITCCINIGTSLLAGFVVFPVLGFMALQQGVTVADAADSGPGLAFIAYPEALSYMPVAPLWASLFFFMLVLLGLDSQFVHVETFITGVLDLYPEVLRKGKRQTMFTCMVCAACFLLGLSMVTEGGMYVFQIIDFYVSGLFIIATGLLECVVVAWIYGVNRFCDNIEEMLGFRPSLYLKINWLVLIPASFGFILVLSFIDYSELTYNRTYHYPHWAIIMGWLMSMAVLIIVPIYGMMRMLQTPGSPKKRLAELIRPKLSVHQIHDRQENRLGEVMDHLTNDINKGNIVNHSAENKC